MDAGTETSAGSDMLDPLSIALDLTAHRGRVGLLDLAGDRTRFSDLAVIDGANGHDLGRRAGEERFVAGVEVAAKYVADPHLVAEVLRNRDHAVLGDALQGTG